MLRNLLSACMCLCMLAGGLRAQSEDGAFLAAARKTQQTYEKAVIPLAAVLKFEAKGISGISGMNEEHKTQCVAAVIDPSGLVVTSLTNFNPQWMMKKIRIRSQTLELDCQVQEVKYRLSDGTELPARIVLKDEDLDLAFLAPQKPLDEPTRSKLAVIPLADAASRVEALDPTVLLGRADEDLNFAPLLNIGRIEAVLSQPRTCYVNDEGVFGTPVFDRQGKLLGIVCRCVKGENADEGMIRLQTTATHLVLPAADVARLVPQAKEEAKKAAEAEEEAGCGQEESGRNQEKIEPVPCPRLSWACRVGRRIATCPRQAWAWHPTWQLRDG